MVTVVFVAAAVFVEVVVVVVVQVVVVVVVCGMVISLAAVVNIREHNSYNVFILTRDTPREEKILHPFIRPILALECASSITTAVRLTQELNLRANHKGSDTNDIFKTWLPQWKYD